MVDKVAVALELLAAVVDTPVLDDEQGRRQLALGQAVDGHEVGLEHGPLGKGLRVGVGAEVAAVGGWGGDGAGGGLVGVEHAVDGERA